MIGISVFRLVSPMSLLPLLMVTLVVAFTFLRFDILRPIPRLMVVLGLIAVISAVGLVAGNVGYIDNGKAVGTTATSAEPRVQQLQTALRTDTQNGELWFALGEEYLKQQAFDEALLVFGYAERLSDFPDANIFAGLASARYYQQRQNMDEQTSTWLAQALNLSPNNQAALTLMASDHRLHGRYQQAIEAWEQLLDAQSAQTDRVAVIAAINQAKHQLTMQ